MKSRKSTKKGRRTRRGGDWFGDKSFEHNLEDCREYMKNNKGVVVNTRQPDGTYKLLQRNDCGDEKNKISPAFWAGKMGGAI